MKKQPKLTFNGAAYSLTSCGDYGINLCETEEEYAIFLEILERTLASFTWNLYAFCLTKSHYYLLVDTPKGNLPDGMRFFSSQYAQRIQRVRGTNGHFFRESYQATPVEGTAEFLAMATNDIHLEPARQKLFNLKTGTLSDYAWSSYNLYLRPSARPSWLSINTVLNAQGFNDDRSGLTRYRNLLKKQTASKAAKTTIFKNEWAIGSTTFKTQLLDLLDEKLRHISPGSISGNMMAAYFQRQAEQLLTTAMDSLKLSRDELKHLKKMDPRKQAICWYLKQNSSVRSRWITEQLHMGDTGNTSLATRNVKNATDGLLFELRKRVINEF